MTTSMDIKTDSDQKVVSLSDDKEWKEQQEIPEEPTNRTLIELGMETLTVKRIRGYKRIAQVLKSVGMVEYERGRLMHREHSLEAAILAITHLVVNDGNKDTKVAAAQALHMLIGAANKTAELNIRLEELARERVQEQKAGAGLPPMMVNVYPPAPTSEMKKAEGTTIIQ